MTNYQKWDQWNADEESDKITAREGTEQLEQKAAKDERKLLAQLDKVDTQTKQVAEAFRSQAAVDALKAKGGMRNRRKRGGGSCTAAVSTDADPPVINKDTETVTDTDTDTNTKSNLLQQSVPQEEEVPIYIYMSVH